MIEFVQKILIVNEYQQLVLCKGLKITEIYWNRVQKKLRLHGCELEEGFLNFCQFWWRLSNFTKKSRLRKILMHVNKVIWHEENIGTIFETLHRCCIMRKDIRKEVTAWWKLEFFLDSILKIHEITRKLSKSTQIPGTKSYLRNDWALGWVYIQTTRSGLKIYRNHNQLNFFGLLYQYRKATLW